MSKQLKSFLSFFAKRVTTRVFRFALGILFGIYISNATMELIIKLISRIA